MDEPVLEYQLALILVAKIDRNLRRSKRQYKTTSGIILNTLEDVVNAILANTLDIPDDAPIV